MIRDDFLSVRAYMYILWTIINVYFDQQHPRRSRNTVTVEESGAENTVPAEKLTRRGPLCAWMVLWSPCCIAAINRPVEPGRTRHSRGIKFG